MDNKNAPFSQSTNKTPDVAVQKKDPVEAAVPLTVATPGTLNIDALDDLKDQAINKNVETSSDGAVELTVPESYQSPITNILDVNFNELNEMISMSHHDHIALAKLMDQLDDSSAENIMFKEIVQKFGAEKALQWLTNTSESLGTLSYKNGLVPAANRQDADWKQGIEYNGHLYTLHRPGIEEKVSDDGRLRGKQAMVRIRSLIKMGDYITVDLPHSGIWVTLEIPGDDVLVNFRMRLLSEKVELGRRTNGLVFSNTNIFVAKHMADMLLSCVSTTSVGITDKAELLKLIKEPDLDILAHAYMCGRYRDGYTLAESCTANPTSCVHIQMSKVSLPRMKITDNRLLSDAQKAHMANMYNQSVKNVVAYQESFATFRDNVYSIDGVLELTLQVPTLDTKIKYGTRWVNDIVDSLDIVFNNELTQDHRNQAIAEQAGINNLVTYAHWIKCIKFTDGGFVDDENMIIKTLIELNRSKEYSEKIYEAINGFINRSAVTIIAVPRFVCPECKGRQPKVNDVFPAFTPINMCKVFFTVMTNTLRTYYERSDI